MIGKSVELVRKRKGQDPPAHLLWEAIAYPLSEESRGWAWFEPRADEQAPEILEAIKPTRVVWGSIWRDRTDLRVEFDIEPQKSGSGCVVTWILFGPDGSLDADDLERRRYRTNQLINGILRDFFDQ